MNKHVPPHPIECDDIKQALDVLLDKVPADTMRRLDEFARFLRTGNTEPVVADVDAKPKKSLFDDLPGGKQNPHFQKELAELEAEVLAREIVEEYNRSSAQGYKHADAIVKAAASITKAFQSNARPLTQSDEEHIRLFRQAFPGEEMCCVPKSEYAKLADDALKYGREAVASHVAPDLLRKGVTLGLEAAAKLAGEQAITRSDAYNMACKDLRAKINVLSVDEIVKGGA